jgi:hypothetical protein
MTLTTKGAIIGGCVGLVIMFVIMESGASAPGPIFLLWPSCVFGFGYNGQGGIDGLFVWSVEIGVQFLIYAALGWAIGLGLRMIRGEG